MKSKFGIWYDNNKKGEKKKMKKILYPFKEGFDNNCCLINDDTWLDQYGALSYFVNEEWKHKVDEKIYS